MGKSATFDNDLLLLIFNATTIANLAINATSSPLTSLYVSLHTANPGTAAPQTTSEAAYTGYARQAVTRSNVGFTVTAASVSPAANVTFPAATAGSETETYFGIGTAVSGTGKLLYSGAISPTIAVVAGVQPVLTTASTVTEA
jgi:hypothetical protein